MTSANQRPTNPVATTASMSLASEQKSKDDPVAITCSLVEERLNVALKRLMTDIAMLIDARDKAYQQQSEMPTSDILQKRVDDVNRILDQIDMQFHTLIELDKQNKLVDKYLPFAVLDDDQPPQANPPRGQVSQAYLQQYMAQQRNVSERVHKLFESAIDHLKESEERR